MMDQEEGPWKGPKTESYIIGEHFSRIGRASEAPIWNNTPADLWVGTYGIMIELAEIFCYPWLKNNQAYQEAIKEINVSLPNDLEDYTEIMDYVHRRNEQLKAIYMAVHDAGVIYPKEIPMENAKEILENMSKRLENPEDTDA